MSHPSLSHHVADSCSGAFAQFATTVRQEEDGIIRRAIEILERRLFHAGPLMAHPDAVGDYLRLHLAAEPSEVFAVIFLDGMNRALAFELLFRGSIHQTSVHPRVVVQRAMALNAASAVFAHQHPSGTTEPSEADRAITKTLAQALSLVDVKVLDHLVIGQGKPYSFAAHGLL
ncbi:MAG: DNA repair protein RadC [Candidatus Accumulibacter sp.]|jgi:DNA repair protein RadC|nr:DNA repair protein RadC [Accumulibacter sp.]